MKAYDTMRDFLALLEEKKDLVRITKEVDPHLELNTIIDKLARTDGPAVVFENVKGSSIPVLGNMFTAGRRINWALRTNDFDELCKQSAAELIKIRQGGTSDYLPVEVSREQSVCKEIIIEEDDIDLDTLPILKFWPKDGGKYLSMPLLISRDPESGRHNIGIYSMMQHDKKSLCVHWIPRKNGSNHFSKACQMGIKEMQIAVALSADPVLGLVSTFAINDPLDEYMTAGVLQREPLKLIKAEDSDLLVPANAEIILEGTVRTDELVEAGPYSEFHGYYSPVEKTPLFRVRKITMRRNPMLQVAAMGSPATETYSMAKAYERLAVHLVKEHFPNIVDFNLTKEAGAVYMLIVSIDKQAPFEARDLINAMWKWKSEDAFITNIIVVDKMIDVQNIGQVLWAISIHCRPELDVYVSKTDTTHPVSGQPPHGTGACLGLDATVKNAEEGYLRQMPDLVKMDEAVDRKVDEKWEKYGFKRI